MQLKFIASDSLRLGQNLDGGSLIEAAVDDLLLYDSQNSSTSILTNSLIKPKLIKVTDLLGRQLDMSKNYNNVNLIYYYENGKTEKISIFD